MIVEHHDNGEIYSVIKVYPPAMLDMLREQGRRFVHVMPPVKWDVTSEGYVNEFGALMRRSPLNAHLSKAEIAADGVDEAVISNLPVGCTVRIDENPVLVEDGTLRISSDMPATYEVVIEHWPYLPWQATITAA